MERTREVIWTRVSFIKGCRPNINKIDSITDKAKWIHFNGGSFLFDGQDRLYSRSGVIWTQRWPRWSSTVWSLIVHFKDSNVKIWLENARDLCVYAKDEKTVRCGSASQCSCYSEKTKVSRTLRSCCGSGNKAELLLNLIWRIFGVAGIRSLYRRRAMMREVELPETCGEILEIYSETHG